MTTLLLAIDLAGTFVFALSGALAGVERRLDLFGVLVLSFAAGTFGGIASDVLIGAVPPASISDWRYLAASLDDALDRGAHAPSHPLVERAHVQLEDRLVGNHVLLGPGLHRADGDDRGLRDLARRLRPLRDEGVLSCSAPAMWSTISTPRGDAGLAGLSPAGRPRIPAARG